MILRGVVIVIDTSCFFQFWFVSFSCVICSTNFASEKHGFDLQIMYKYTIFLTQKRHKFILCFFCEFNVKVVILVFNYGLEIRCNADHIDSTFYQKYCFGLRWAGVIFWSYCMCSISFFSHIFLSWNRNLLQFKTFWNK